MIYFSSSCFQRITHFLFFLNNFQNNFSHYYLLAYALNRIQIDEMANKMKEKEDFHLTMGFLLVNWILLYLFQRISFGMWRISKGREENRLLNKSNQKSKQQVNRLPIDDSIQFTSHQFFSFFDFSFDRWKEIINWIRMNETKWMNANKNMMISRNHGKKKISMYFRSHSNKRDSLLHFDFQSMLFLHQ